MEYKDYKLLDFLMDEDFQQWALFPTELSDQFWHMVIRENPDKNAIVNQARAILTSIDYKKTGVSDSDKKNILINIQSSINAEKLKENGRNPYLTAVGKGNSNGLSVTNRLAKKKNRYKFVREIAASLIGILIVAGAFYFSRDSSRETETIVVDYLEKSSLKGEKSNITLSDGTKIKLNSNSKLIIPKLFSDHERRVTLVGEAYFEVSKDASRPFVITSNHIKTVVLGTSFNVRAYPSENTIKVAVAEGQVSVEKTTPDQAQDSQAPIFLLPNEMAVYSKETGQANKESFEPMAMFGWKDGILYFQDADIYEAIEALEQWYGVTFIVKTQLNEDKDLSGSFKKKSLETVLDGLSYVFGFNFEINGKVVTLK